MLERRGSQHLAVRFFLSICVTVAAASGLWQEPSTSDDAVTTVLLVRHAEKSTEPPDDPHLTPAGRERAGVLAHVAEDAGVQTIFVTNWNRTRETASDLERVLGLTAVVPDGGPAELAERILTNHPGGTVLVVAHSNTLPVIITELGGPRVPFISEDTYDNFYVVTIRQKGHAHLVRLKYGSPSS